MSRIILWLISIYQRWISPFFRPHCRFYPTCSYYAYEAIRRYGAVKGLSLTMIRLLKCQPFHSGGTDLVP
ncbi:MAG: membrane protein insertion efficiency factor YidD [Nitrospirales bacterium]|nr:membrane protein insertion efficiency factor YidD [Nitrospira sp.]MDR4500906.1 membrane protein insertion efficiency factor YidD [Nitrospirales bacterium]